MNKKLLLNLINGVLLVSFCNMGKAVGAVSSLHVKERDFPVGEKKAMKKKHKSKKSDQNRLVESVRKVELPPPPPLPQEETREVVQVICNKRVLEVYNLPDYSESDLWKNKLDLTEKIMEEKDWCDSKGVRNLVYYLAKMYKTADQNTKDAIALYLMVTSLSYAGELAGGDDDDTEQEAIDFARQCLVNEEKIPLFPWKE